MNGKIISIGEDNLVRLRQPYLKALKAGGLARLLNVDARRVGDGNL